LALARDAGKPGHVAARGLLRLRAAELAVVAALALGVGDMPVASGRAVSLPTDEPVLFGLAQIPVEDRGIGADRVSESKIL